MAANEIQGCRASALAYLSDGMRSLAVKIPLFDVWLLLR
jgi:hypothetical protein